MKNEKQLNQENIGRLLKMAGPRPTASHDRQGRVKEAVRQQWRASVRARRQRRWLVGGGGLALAAAALIALVGVSSQTLIPIEPAFSGPIGHIETVSGAVRVEDDASGRLLEVGDTLLAGEVIDTGVLGRAAVRLLSGSSLRLDHGTRFRGLSDSVVTLESGALYFDSNSAAKEPLEVRTDLGIVYDIGTQYELRLADEQVRVRVREGSVNVDRDGELFDADAGVELTLDSKGELSRRSVPIFGPDWAWILAVAPPFELEGQTLEVFLDWVGRETGWQSNFSDVQIADSAPEVVLHGSVEGMRPDQALEAVLPTCGLVHRLDGGILRIEAEGP